jgi:hypothetical protein
MKLANQLRLGAKRNSPLILSVFAGLGTVTTAYLAGRASFKAAEIIRKDEEKFGRVPDTKKRLKTQTKLVWKEYIPTGVSAASTIVCIIGANHIAVKKALAAQTALAVSQRAFSEYRDKVVEEIGERKDKAIRDKVVEERVNKKNPPPSGDVLISGPGNVLVCELHTGRYFTSDMEKLKKAQNELNAKLLKHDYATLDDFYYLLDIRQTTTSGQLGWKTPSLMELEFTTVLSDDGRPCLAFAYNYTTTM